jgi:hypothetical protein
VYFRHLDLSTLRREFGRGTDLKDTNGTLIFPLFALDAIFRYKLLSRSRARNCSMEYA